MTYLNNKFCTFITKFDVDIKNKKNIVLFCLFKMETPYKDFNKYTEGLIECTKIIKERLPYFKIRVFIDQNILDDKKLKWLYDSTDYEIVVFKCSKFLSNNKFHKGTFSTLVRFFPTHSFSNNDARHIITVDADTNRIHMNQIIDHYNILKDRNDIYFYYIGSVSASNESHNPHLYPHMMAGRYICFKKTNKEVFL